MHRFLICGAMLILGLASPSIADKKKKLKIYEPDPYKTYSVLVDRGKHTFLAQSAIIYVPDRLKGKVQRGSQNAGTLMTWNKFYRANMSWMILVNVSDAEKNGEEPIPKERMEQYKKMGKIVIAAQGGKPVILKKAAKTSKP